MENCEGVGLYATIDATAITDPPGSPALAPSASTPAVCSRSPYPVKLRVDNWAGSCSRIPRMRCS